ncbi:MAG: CDP-diacylglycerol--serine O-phosphatidyltransferase [Proteobacteria bacterium]|nr:CDP-diacylglycerol--serine O-phosphatidyltransferase [Pseudomonadota bacterium]
MSKRRKHRSKAERRKGIYILPNLFTTASLFAGFYAIISSINGEFMSAAVAIVVSGLFDFLDGKVARMTNTTSQFGVEYDSLADLVAFGVAPGILAYMWALQPFGRLGWVAGFLYVACGALRLARFNVNSSVRSHDYFQGLPIPAAAAMIATTVFLFNHLGESGPVKHGAILVMVFALSFLMVSNFRYLSLKNSELFKSKPFNTLVAVILMFSLIAVRPHIMLFVLGLGYLVSGPILTAYTYRQEHRVVSSDSHFGESPLDHEPTSREPKV